jgi:hypothetical protein
MSELYRSRDDGDVLTLSGSDVGSQKGFDWVSDDDEVREFQYDIYARAVRKPHSAGLPMRRFLKGLPRQSLSRDAASDATIPTSAFPSNGAIDPESSVHGIPVVVAPLLRIPASYVSTALGGGPMRRRLLQQAIAKSNALTSLPGDAAAVDANGPGRGGSATTPSDSQPVSPQMTRHDMEEEMTPMRSNEAATANNHDERTPNDDDDGAATGGGTAGGPSQATAVAESGSELFPTTYFVDYTSYDPEYAFSLAAADTHYPQPTGEINVADILLQIFLFLPFNSSVLVSVSAVSQAWRETSARLPQWCLLPSVYGFDTILSTASWELPAVMATSRPLNTLDGIDIVDRASFMKVMEQRWSQQHDVTVYLRKVHRRASRAQRYVPATQCLLLLVTSAIWIVSVMLMARGLQRSLDAYHRAAQDDVTTDDVVGLVALLTFLICVPVLGLTCCLFNCVHKLCPAISVRQRTLRRRGSVMMLCVVIATSLSTSVPLALLASRSGQAKDMADDPRVLYGSTDATCRPASALAFGDWVSYVQIANAWEWTLRPWAEGHAAPTYRLPLNATNGTFRPLCTLAGNTTQAWVEWFITSRDSEQQCWEAFVPPLVDGGKYNDNAPREFQAFAFVLLYPPASVVAACPGAGPLAVPIDSGQASLVEWAEALGRGEWHGAAEQGSLTTLRTALDRPWFRTPWAHEMGRQWFTAYPAAVAGGMNVTWFNATTAAATYLWNSQRIPLVLPYAVQGPDVLYHMWNARLWVVLGLNMAVIAAAIVLECVPQRRLGTTKLHTLCMLFAAVALNPIWLVIFGGICAFAWNSSVCMLSPLFSLELMCIGGALIAAMITGYVIRICCGDD